MSYVWVPFSWLPIGMQFEPIDVLHGYAPICTKTGTHEGVAKDHMGEKLYLIPSEEYVRIRTGF